MKFCIYQINLDRDTDRVAFEDLENLQRYHGGRVIRSDLYDKIYEEDFTNYAISCHKLFTGKLALYY